jgi:hypothetical protein
MPRAAAAGSLDSIILSVIRPAVTAIVKSIAKIVAEQVDAQVRTAVRAQRGSNPRPRAAVNRRPRFGRTEIRKWTADRRARRVPTFVIEATGLDTKKKIVAKYGENATFEKGKPLPKAA